MTNEPNTIQPGSIQLLWSIGYYDGMITGIGLLDEHPVYLDASERMGGYILKPRWQEFETLTEELLDDDDLDMIWDLVEKKYKIFDEEKSKRLYEVRQLTPEMFDKAKVAHSHFQIHVGLHCDFRYEDGTPRRSGIPRYEDEICWHNSNEYIKAHYYDAQKGFLFSHLTMKEFPLLGLVSWQDLVAKSNHNPEFPKDPRFEELKKYQKSWMPGDKVKLDW